MNPSQMPLPELKSLLRLLQDAAPWRPAELTNHWVNLCGFRDLWQRAIKVDLEMYDVQSRMRAILQEMEDRIRLMVEEAEQNQG